MNKHLAALAAALILAAPIAANAQDVPSYAASDTADQQIQGRIANFDGGYNLQVRDANGYVDNVQLHDGTIINPTGLTLVPGMVVSIVGFTSGPVFDANEIDTPYSFDAGVPFYAGHPWNYYGPSISLGFFFGSGNAWHGGTERAFAYAPSVRVDNTVRVENVQNRRGQSERNEFIARQAPQPPSRPAVFAGRPSSGSPARQAAPRASGGERGRR